MNYRGGASLVFLKVSAAVLLGFLASALFIGPATAADDTTAPSRPTSITAPPPAPLQLPADEAYLLQKLRMQQELQGDVLKWAQTRFWLIAVVAFVVGYFGVRSSVREMVATELKDAVRASADAQAAASQGRDAVKEVRCEAAKYRDFVEELKTAAADVDKQLKEVRSRIEAEGARSVAASDLKISALDQQVAELNSIVRQLFLKSQDTRLMADSDKRLAEFRQLSASKQAAFEANAQFDVIVVGHRSAPKHFADGIVDSLSKEGFKASTGYWAPNAPVRDSIKIDYKPQAEEKAKLVQSIVSKSLKSYGDDREILLQERPSFTKHDPRDIRVFL